MAKRLPQQVIKVKNYGEVEVNMLAVIGAVLEKMTDEQRLRAFHFFKSKYSKAWPSDSYQ